MFSVCVRTVGRDTVELARDVRAVEIGREESQDLELPLAERLDQWLSDGRPRRGRDDGGEQPAQVARRRCVRFAASLSSAAIGGPSSTKTRT